MLCCAALCYAVLQVSVGLGEEVPLSALNGAAVVCLIGIGYPQASERASERTSKQASKQLSSRAAGAAPAIEKCRQPGPGRSSKRTHEGRQRPGPALASSRRPNPYRFPPILPRACPPPTYPTAAHLAIDGGVAPAAAGRGAHRGVRGVRGPPHVQPGGGQGAGAVHTMCATGAVGSVTAPALSFSRPSPSHRDRLLRLGGRRLEEGEGWKKVEEGLRGSRGTGQHRDWSRTPPPHSVLSSTSDARISSLPPLPPPPSPFFPPGKQAAIERVRALQPQYRHACILMTEKDYARQHNLFDAVFGQYAAEGWQVGGRRAGVCCCAGWRLGVHEKRRAGGLREAGALVGSGFGVRAGPWLHQRWPWPRRVAPDRRIALGAAGTACGTAVHDFGRAAPPPGCDAGAGEFRGRGR